MSKTNLTNSNRKDETMQRIIDAAGEGIRMHGYGGIGVDGIAKKAGVTSGAIYGSFGSKANVFEATVAKGMNDFVKGITKWKEQNGENWLELFVEWYLSIERIEDICGSCALPGLSVDVYRANGLTQAAYEKQWLIVKDIVATGVLLGTEEQKQDKAMALLALLCGAVTMYRALVDKDSAKAIATASIATAKTIIVS